MTEIVDFREEQYKPIASSLQWLIEGQVNNLVYWRAYPPVVCDGVRSAATRDALVGRTKHTTVLDITTSLTKIASDGLRAAQHSRHIN